MNCPAHATVHIYTGQVSFYKVPETHGNVNLVTLYTFGSYLLSGGPSLRSPLVAEDSDQLPEDDGDDNNDDKILVLIIMAVA